MKKRSKENAAELVFKAIEKRLQSKAPKELTNPLRLKDGATYAEILAACLVDRACNDRYGFEQLAAVTGLKDTAQTEQQARVIFTGENDLQE